MPEVAATLEKLTSDLHDLIFDVQEARTDDDRRYVHTEGKRIALALRRLFDA